MEYNKRGAGVHVYAAGRNKAKIEKRFRPVKSDMLTYVEHDALDHISFDIEADYIIHAGGNAHPAAFNSDPVGTIIGNINGTYNLLEYGRKHNTKRFCYISSGEVYGQGDMGLDSFVEEYSGHVDPLPSRSCYPNSKRATETLCASYSRQYGLEIIIVRPCHTYGAGFTEEDSRANAQFFRNVLRGEDIVMKSAGQQMRSYCYVADCASCIITALINGNSGEAYNSANPVSRITIAGLAEEIAKAAGRKVVFEDPSASELANQTPIAKQVLSSDKIEKLGWKGHYTVKEGVSHTLAILHGE
jgi:nucleoside-diphosphate-sugar epimerase